LRLPQRIRGDGVASRPWILAAGLAVACSACTASGLGVPAVTLAAQVGDVATSSGDPCEIQLTFPGVQVGDEASATLQIKNDGKSPLHLFAIDAGPNPGFVLSEIPQVVPVDGAGQLQVTFQPEEVGTVSWSFQIPTDSSVRTCPPDGNLSVVLTGTGTAFPLSFSPSVLDFSFSWVDTTEVLTATLTNRSAVAMSGITAALIGPSSGAFEIGEFPTWLDAGDSMAINFTYEPFAWQGHSIASAIFQAASGETAEIDLFGAMCTINQQITPNPLTLSSWGPGQSSPIGCAIVSSPMDNVTLEDTANFDTAAGVFALSTVDASGQPASSLPMLIGPDAGVAEICFTYTPPPTTSIASGSIQLQFSAEDFIFDAVPPCPGEPTPPTLTLQLRGDRGGPAISCDATHLDFGQTLVGTSKTLQLVCFNSGTAGPGSDLVINRLTTGSGPFSASLDPVQPYPAILAPGQSLVIDLTYQPNAETEDVSGLTIASNLPPLSISLSGEGELPQPCQAAFVPQSLAFGKIPAGETSAALSFEIQNLGDATCVLPNPTLQQDSCGAFHLLSGPAGWECRPRRSRSSLPPGSQDCAQLRSDPCCSLERAHDGAPARSPAGGDRETSATSGRRALGAGLSSGGFARGSDHRAAGNSVLRYFVDRRCRCPESRGTSPVRAGATQSDLREPHDSRARGHRRSGESLGRGLSPGSDRDVDPGPAATVMCYVPRAVRVPVRLQHRAHQRNCL
jgi:Abnormal spindle-like microcephaly-assoc'd, ASPM-SPD-2-Hydin